MKWKLIMSAPTMEQLINYMATKFWFCDPEDIVLWRYKDDYTLEVEGRKIEGARIIKKSNRYRFERESI